jgi:hypothetical protein
MAYNFSQCIAQTRTYLDEVSPKSWTDFEVQREVNNGYGELITTVIQVFEDFYQRRTDFSLINGKQEYTVADGVPSDVYKIKRIEYNGNTTNNPTSFYRASPTNINNFRSTIVNTNLGSTSMPLYYTYGFGTAMTIGFLPIPQINSTNGVRLWYIYEVPMMANPTDTVNIPYSERYASLIALYAAAVLLRKGQQEEAVAARYMTEFDEGKQEMMEELKQRNVDDAGVIMDSIGLNTDFSMVDLYY